MTATPTLSRVVRAAGIVALALMGLSALHAVWIVIQNYSRIGV